MALCTLLAALMDEFAYAIGTPEMGKLRLPLWELDVPQVRSIYIVYTDTLQAEWNVSVWSMPQIELMFALRDTSVFVEEVQPNNSAKFLQFDR